MDTFATIEDFYADDELRRRSMERDYGVWWKDDAGGNWRVTWVEATGEIYALRLGPTKTGEVRIGDSIVSVTANNPHPDREGPVVVLGEIPASWGECNNGFCSSSFHAMDCPADSGYHVEKALDGWAEVCGAIGSLHWIKARVS